MGFSGTVRRFNCLPQESLVKGEVHSIKGRSVHDFSGRQVENSLTNTTFPSLYGTCFLSGLAGVSFAVQRYCNEQSAIGQSRSGFAP